jgi:hypothetical protein
MSMEFKPTGEAYENAKTWRSDQVIEDEMEAERKRGMD